MKLKVMSYNIRHGQGIGKIYSLRSIAEAIAKENPDIVGLNEVYQIPPFLDQPKKLSEMLGMEYVFQSNVTYGPFGGYGNIILTKGEIKTSECIQLPKVAGIENRGISIAEIFINNKNLFFGTTHLGLRKIDRDVQISHLTEYIRQYSPIIFCGDFNGPVSELSSLLKDYNLAGEYKTYPANNPRKQFDYIFASKILSKTSSDAIASKASDHLPIVAEYII